MMKNRKLKLTTKTTNMNKKVLFLLVTFIVAAYAEQKDYDLFDVRIIK